MNRIEWPEAVVRARDILSRSLPGGLAIPDATRLLFDNEGAVAQRIPGERARLRTAVREARAELTRGGLNPGPAEAVLHYRHLENLLEGAIRTNRERAVAGVESIDRLLLHRFWGSVIFVAIMWVVFQSIYTWAGPMMDLIEAATTALQGWVGPKLIAFPTVQSLVTDGVIAGAGGVIVFLPQIFILFFFLGLLEDTGYLARAAFLMDKLFGWCGLNGKSFVPLLSSYACAIPGVMAARTMEDPKARLTTILMAPFMSCSARLPVYVLLIGAFIEPRHGAAVAGWVLLAMHFLGLAVALPLAWFMNRVIMRTRPLPFILEMPPYRTPRWRDLLTRMWERGREFLIRAGTIILALSVIIWALLYFPRDPSVRERETMAFLQGSGQEYGQSTGELEGQLADQDSSAAQTLAHRIQSAYVEQSYLGRFGRAVQPIFALAGFDWKITVGVLSSFPAREVIISTLGIIYRLGTEQNGESGALREVMAAERWTVGPLAGRPVFTVPVVLSIMVFFALCLQCGATVAVIAKELRWRWAIGSFVGMTVIAWMAAVIVYQIGIAITGLPPIST
jgi:ferrous iron transport protein B